MNIIVLIKEAPDMERVRFDRERGVIDRASAGAEINPFDLHALQAAVDLKARHGARVTAVSMGPERCAASLRDAWARGADRCVCVTDRRIAGSDTLATARALSAAISRMEYDLVLCGEKTVDGDTAQVGAEVAELLGIPHSYYAQSIDGIDGEHVRLISADICGSSQARRMRLPALVSVSRRISAPLLPPLKRKLDSLSVEIEKVGLDELGLSEELAGLKGSPTRVSKIMVPPPAQRKGRIFRDDLRGFAECFVEAARPAAGRQSP